MRAEIRHLEAGPSATFTPLCSFVEVHTGQILTIPSHRSLIPAYLQARQLHSDSNVDLARLT